MPLSLNVKTGWVENAALLEPYERVRDAPQFDPNSRKGVLTREGAGYANSESCLSAHRG